MKPFASCVRLIGLCALIAACAPTKTAPQPILAVRDYQATFLCDGQSIHVVFAPFKAVLDLRGASVAMVQQPAADGFQYTGGGQSLRQAGQITTWTDDKGVARQCQEIPANR